MMNTISNKDDVKKYSFLSQCLESGRITIPYHVREVLGIEKGDLVFLTIKKEKKQQQLTDHVKKLGRD